MTKNTLMPEDIDGFIQFAESNGFVHQSRDERTITVNFDDLIALFRAHQNIAAELRKFEKKEN